METCCLITESIVGINDDIVSFGDIQWRNWPLSIDAHDISTIFSALRRWCDPRNIEVVRDSSGKRSPCKQEEGRQWIKKIGERNRHISRRISPIGRGNISEEFSKLFGTQKRALKQTVHN